MYGQPSNRHALPPAEEPAPGPTKVELYREERLLAAGYSPMYAELLSRTKHVDLHQAVDMVTKDGCPHSTALKILL